MGLLSREGHYHGCSRLSGVNIECPLQLPNSFLHALHADPDFRRHFPFRIKLRNASAGIADLNRDFAETVLDTNCGTLTARMAMDVGQRFLHDPEKSGFGFLRESRQFRIQV